MVQTTAKREKTDTFMTKWGINLLTAAAGAGLMFLGENTIQKGAGQFLLDLGLLGIAVVVFLEGAAWIKKRNKKNSI